MPRAALTLLLFLVVAAPASAGGTIYGAGTRPVLEGPVWAGDRVAWVTEERYGVGVHVAEPGGAGHATTAIQMPSPSGFVQAGTEFSASAERWALDRFGQRCDGKQVCSFFGGLYTGPLGGQPGDFRRNCASVAFGPARIAVSGNALAYSCNGTVRVRDFSDGADSGEFAAERFELAGPLLASFEKEPAVVVRDWRTGAERLRLAGVPSARLQADGKVAFARTRGGVQEIAWASPESPEPRVVAEGASLGLLGFARDRVLLARGGLLEVRALDGGVLASSPHIPPQPDFDGARLTWSERPCVLLAVATWDLEGTPPTLGRDRCPRAGNRSKLLRAKPTKPGTFGFGAISTVLECPAEPRLGCGGTLHLDFGPSTLDLARGTYELMPGETRRVEFGLLKRRICIAGRAALGPVQLTLDGAKRRWVRISGLRRALAECEGRA